MSIPSVQSHGTLDMIMVNLAKSWLTMVPLSRSWQIMIHGTLATIAELCELLFVFKKIVIGIRYHGTE